VFPVSPVTAQVVDLEMSDQEYLELLAQGRNPVQEHLYIQELLSYHLPLDMARQVAPLFAQGDRTLEEKILVGYALRHIWDTLSTPLYWVQ
jgi:hypothetical protein